MTRTCFRAFGAFALMASLAGCAATIQKAETGVHLAVSKTSEALQALKNNQATIATVGARVEAILPKTGAAHTAALKVQAAWSAYKASQGSLDEVEAALAELDDLTAPSEIAPVGSRS
jgi:hypothetical protein